MNHKLLIVCFSFPPSPGIGGRRSAKFAKYLAKKGDEVFVIQAKNPYQNESPWLKDVENNNWIKRFELPLNYPVEFIIPPKTFAGKLRYRLYNYYFTIFYAKKNRYDYSIFWNKNYLEKAEGLILKYRINNVLVSGPPFYYAHCITRLKDTFPDLNIIIDFRDPWIGSPYYGMSNLKKNQQQHEIKLFNELFLKANFFTGPNEFLLNRQKQFIYETNSRGAIFVEIPHAFDTDEINFSTQLEPKKKSDKIKMVYGGQFYPGTELILKALSSLLTKLKTNNSTLYSKLQLEFYVPETDRISYFTEHAQILQISKPIGNEIMAKINEADYCLIFLAEHNKDYKTTKFLEYAVLRKPFILLGERGHVAEFVEQARLGKAYDAESIFDLEKLLLDSEGYIKNTFNATYNLDNFSFEIVIEKLRALLI